jgi:hypothetical protein
VGGLIAEEDRIAAVLVGEPQGRALRFCGRVEFGVGMRKLEPILAAAVAPGVVRIRRTLSEEKRHVEVVTCREPTADAAEKTGLVHARRWIDRRAWEMAARQAATIPRR